MGAAVRRPDVPEAGTAVPEGALLAARVADDKLGRDTVVLAVGPLLGVVDAFVITGGSSSRQVKTLVEEVERRLKQEARRSPASVEGLADATWVLMDYGDFLVHVFSEEARTFYDLEHLWAGAPRVAWQTPPD